MIKRQILVIESDLSIFHSIQEYMQDDTTDICGITTVADALDSFMKFEYCMVIMDLHLSEVKSLEMLRTMRAAKHTPILVLADHLEPDGKIALFHAGANAYMEKPIDVKVCAAQSEALIQLYLDSDCETKESFPLTFGTELIINPIYRQVIIDGSPVELTRTEFDLLFCLARHPGQVLSRDQLYHQVWKDDMASTGDNIVRTHIGNLRKKLTDAGKNCVQNSRGIGYKFIPPVARQ